MHRRSALDAIARRRAVLKGQIERSVAPFNSKGNYRAWHQGKASWTARERLVVFDMALEQLHRVSGEQEAGPKQKRWVSKSRAGKKHDDRHPQRAQKRVR
jgi:hypothetical protein